ncbi:hypothetical protein E3U55_08620 [Filobacillus milosensis]|uniref:Tetratricopeptide repeat protein n=1 Tax=Filobacillus milosensis TaxID=94137 RepID=A0A4Y8IMZ8_9BACI|nr:hypothetical protein [Filobacillus milosensis]TFB21369.1 hypothetical protein E3U55_08620 [Filobacillus milosensis]
MSTAHPDFVKAKQNHDKGVEGDEAAVEIAYQMFKKLQKAKPSDPLIQAYYGSTVTLVGRDASKNKERIKVANHGLEILDRVVNQVPNHIEVRLLRAYVNSRIPEKYFKRTDQAIEDLEYLKTRYEKDSSIFPQDQYEDILYELSNAYKRSNNSDQAKLIEKKLLSVNPKFDRSLGKKKKKRKKEG